MSTNLSMWIVLSDLDSFPGEIIAQHLQGTVSGFVYTPMVIRPEIKFEGDVSKLNSDHVKACQLEVVRATIKELSPSAVCFARADDDDEHIVETWL